MHRRGLGGLATAVAAMLVAGSATSLAQDITLDTRNLSGRHASCRNIDSAQSVGVLLGSSRSVNCTGEGLVTAGDEAVVIRFVGEVAGPSEGGLAGRVSGLDTETAVCRNVTTGQSEMIALNGSTQFGCGLGISAGDRVELLVRGTAPGGGGEPLPECTMTFDDGMCPNAGEVCGATFTGGNGCIFAGLGLCYDTGLFGYELSAGDLMSIEFSGDVNTLDVFFATAGPEEGTMLFFDGSGAQVQPTAFTNGDCLMTMPPSQFFMFDTPVRSMLVQAHPSNDLYLDTFHINP